MRYQCLLWLGFAAMIPAAPATARTLEQDVLDELNFVRTHPQQYADELWRYRDGFDGSVITDEAGEHTTYEGPRAVEEAIRFLDRQTPLGPLDRGSVLERAAVDHALEQGSRGSMGHLSRNGLTPARRVALRGGGIYVSETISYGFSDPRAIVRSLIVDDGVSSRIHRSVIFMSFLRYAGVGCSPHVSATYECVIDYSQTSDGRAPLPDRLARSEVPSVASSQPF